MVVTLYIRSVYIWSHQHTEDFNVAIYCVYVILMAPYVHIGRPLYVLTGNVIEAHTLVLLELSLGEWELVNPPIDIQPPPVTC